MIRIVGQAGWRAVQGLTVPRVEHVDFSHIKHVVHVPEQHKPPPRFPHVMTVSVQNCDEHWIRTCLDPRMFPRARYLILGSAVNEGALLHRFPITLTSHWTHRSLIYPNHVFHIRALTESSFVQYFKALDQGVVMDPHTLALVKNEQC